MTTSLHFGKPDRVERVPCPLTERRLLLPDVAQKLQAPADLMELAGFCRNCLANWYQEAAAAKGVSLSKEEAREIIYGMPYETWKAMFQKGPAKPHKHAG